MQPQRTPTETGRRLRLVLLAGFLTGAAMVLYIAAGNFRAGRLNFVAPPPSELLRHVEATGVANFEAITFSGQRGARIAGWFAPPQNRATVVLLHGTSADRTAMLPEARILAKARFGVLAFDWPGYGESEGDITWGRQERDALKGAIDWLARRPDVDPNRIGALGFSMGGFILAQVAAEDVRLKALVFAATPTDMREQVLWESRRWGPLSQGAELLSIRVSSMPLADPSPKRCVGELGGRPVLIFGGDADGTVPPSMTKALYDAAQEPKELWMVPGVGHGGYAAAAPDYSARLIAFFTRTLRPTGST